MQAGDVDRRIALKPHGIRQPGRPSGRAKPPVEKHFDSAPLLIIPSFRWVRATLQHVEFREGDRYFLGTR